MYGLGFGDLTITLGWYDYNDLDLYVTCPCGTELYHGRRSCDKCGGYLDRDMNVCSC